VSPAEGLAVDIRGRGKPTVLLVHGLAVSREIFGDVAARLVDRFRCVVPDLRGHGDSPGRSIGSLTEFAEDLAPLLHAEGPLYVCGESFAAGIALRLWHLQPGLIRGLVLVDPVLDRNGLWSWARDRSASDSEARLALVAPFIERNPTELRALIAEYPLMAHLDEPARALIARGFLRASPETVRSTLRLLVVESDLPGRPPGASAPVTVIRATRSLACPPAIAAAFCRRIGAEIEEIDSGHCVSLGAPDDLAAAIERHCTA
jgi:pimeloyl-ACP methyl ester carboxylesterase